MPTPEPAKAMRVEPGQLRVRLLAALEEVERKPFDWGKNEELPIRPDVAFLARDAFSDPSHPILGHGEFGVPTLELVDDGTLDVEFVDGPRTLALTFLCRDAIRFAAIQDLAEGEAATWDGVVEMSDPGKARERMAELANWFRGRKLR